MGRASSRALWCLLDRHGLGRDLRRGPIPGPGSGWLVSTFPRGTIIPTGSWLFSLQGGPWRPGLNRGGPAATGTRLRRRLRLCEAVTQPREHPKFALALPHERPGQSSKRCLMLRAWHLLDFGPDLSRLRRSAIVIAESAEAARRLCPDLLVIPFPARSPVGEVSLIATRSVAWIYAT